MAYHYQKHFTLAEARALLPELRKIFQDALRRRDQIHQTEKQLGRQVKKTGGDAGGDSLHSLLFDYAQMGDQMRRIEKLGVVVKDFDRGLLDFPHLREGREVFLCWELEEDDIEFWHDLDTGHAGRERL